jgi:hypothetical protein
VSVIRGHSTKNGADLRRTFPAQTSSRTLIVVNAFDFAAVAGDSKPRCVAVTTLAFGPRHELVVKWKADSCGSVPFELFNREPT